LALERLDRNDAKVLLLWILADLVGAGVAYSFFYRAFPEASVEFKVPREEALATARQFAAAQGAKLDGYDSTIVFDLDETAKTYLEREVGLQQANRMMAGDVHVWYWQARFFRPLQKEEFDVRVNPAGGVVGYSHVLEEAAPGGRPQRAEAQGIAESFLRDALHANLAEYDFREAEANPTERPSRRDWSFSWERRGFRAKDAPYRLNVSLAGDRVSGYDEFLKVPEAWEIGYKRLRSWNDLFEIFAAIPAAFLLGGCLYVISYLGRRGLIEWRAGLVLGGFLAVLFFFMTMNQWPLVRAEYDTNTPYFSFFLSEVGTAALTSVGMSLLVILAVVPGEPLYRILEPDKIRLTIAPRLPGLRSKEFFRANVIGLSLAAVHIGYITIFYIIVAKFGAWAPQDIKYENVLSTSLPWLYPLTIGIYAATSEEFLFRLFAIPFLLRLTKSRFWAVVLPAFFWGFLHSNYPQEPAYIRGIEVGLIGIVAGLVLLRWGILATLIWHYTVDAFLISTSLMRSQGAYLHVSGAIVGGAALISLAIAGVSYLLRGGFVADASLLNRAQPPGGPPMETGLGPQVEAGGAITEEKAAEEVAATVIAEPAELPAAAAEYKAMSSRAMATLVACGLAGFALLAVVKREEIGDFVHFSIDSKEAITRAGDVLRANGVSPATYYHAATETATFDGYTNEYLRRTIGIAAANRVYHDEVPSAFWAVRYFRDSQNEEYLVVLKPDGSLHSLHHTLDEKAPGANLLKEEALARAEDYLVSQKGVRLAEWNLADSQTDKKPNRTDHVFQWEQKTALDSAFAKALADRSASAGISAKEGAHLRVELRVQGDEVSNYRIFIKIPEAWRDAESRTTAVQIAQSFGRAGAIAFVFIAVLVIFLKNLRGLDVAAVPWRRLAKWSLLLFVAGLVVSVNRAPQLLSNYATAVPLAIYTISVIISLLFITALYLAGGSLLLGFAWFFLRRAFGSSWAVWRGAKAPYYRDAFFIGLFGSGAMLGLDRLPALLEKWPLMRHALGAVAPSGLDQLCPAAGSLASAVTMGFVAVGLIGLAGGLVAAYVQAPWMRAGLVILYAVLSATNAATPWSFARLVAFRLVAAAAVWFGVMRIARFNALGYVLFGASLALIPDVAVLLDQPNAYFHANGYAVLACAFVLLAWPLGKWRSPSRLPAV